MQLSRREAPNGKVDLDLTHNLGGAPFNSVAAVAILGWLDCEGYGDGWAVV